MKKKLTLLLSATFLALLCMGLNAQTKGYIAWLGNNLKADSGYFKILNGAGYKVVDKTATKGDLTADQLAMLDTFDLVIMSRSSNSGDYNFPAKYNAIKAPVLNMANMVARESRWKMTLPGYNDDATTIKDVIRANEKTHAIFSNVVLSDTNTIDICPTGTLIKPLLRLKSAGNGKLIASSAKDSLLMIAEWAEKIPYYTGSLDSIHGKRMIFFNTQGYLLNQNGDRLLLDIVEYMITGTVTKLGPTDLSLSNNKIDEDAPVGSVVGRFKTIDIENNDKFSYSLTAGNGDNDNSSFTISGDSLKLAAKLNFDANDTLKVRVAVKDSSKRSFSKELLVLVNDISNIIFITENQKLDSLYVDLLDKNGFNVTVVTDLKDKVPSDSALAALEASEAIIFSRNTTSGGYQALSKYNSLATPMMVMNAYMARSSRWQLLETSTAVDNDADTIKVLTSTHPIFKNVTIDSNNKVALLDTLKIGTCAIDSALNATVIAKSSKSGNIVIAEWKKNTLFYDKTTNYALGHRLAFFLTNNYALSDAGAQMYVNAVKYLVSFDYDTVLVNVGPSGINISKNTVAENSEVGTTVGTLSAVDANTGDSWIYSLVAGEGDADNASFSIKGSNLLTASTFNYESKTTYNVRINVVDTAGLSFQKSFTIDVTDVNEAPTAINLDNKIIDENLAVGTKVGELSATDVDANTNFKYSLVAGDGTNDADNKSFSIAGSALNTNAVLDYETKANYSIYVEVSDGKLTFKQTFTITVKDVVETGINQMKNNISVYPNPASDYIYVSGEFNSVKIYDLNGRLMLSFGNQAQLNVSALSKGNYIVEINNNGAMSRNMLVIR